MVVFSVPQDQRQTKETQVVIIDQNLCEFRIEKDQCGFVL